MSKAYDSATEKLVEMLTQDLEDHNRFLKQHPTDANTYNLKAQALVKLGKATGNKAYYDKALECHNEAVTLTAQNNAAYLVDRSKFYTEIGETEKAVADMALVSKLPKASGITDIYVNNTIRDLSQLDSVQNTIKQLAINGKINGELAVALEEHAKVTKSLVVQVGAHGERLDKHERDIELIKLVLTSFKEIIGSSQEGEKISADKIAQFNILIQNVKKQVSENTEKISGHEQVLQAGGVYDRAEIKQAFEVKAHSEQEHAYLKTFYWTTINLFEVYRVLSTDLVKGNIDHDETIQAKLLEKGISTGVKKAVSYGVKMAEGVPLIGGFIGMLDSIVDDIYTAIKEHRLENKVNAINKIIQSKFITDRDMEINIAKIALAVTELRKSDILSPKLIEKSQLEIGAKWIMEKINAIKDKVFTSVELHDGTNEAVQLALQDVVLLIAYLCDHYGEIATDTGTPFVRQIESIIQEQRLTEVISTLGKRLESEDNSHTTGISFSFSTSSSSSPSSSHISQTELIEQKIGEKDLAMIHQKAGSGKWAKSFITPGKEIEEFLDESYMKKLFGRSPTAEEIEGARIVIFKHICKGIAENSNDKLGLENLSCAVKFKQAYPQIINKIANTNPDLFYNYTIAEECIKGIADHSLSSTIKQVLSNTQVQSDAQVAALAKEEVDNRTTGSQSTNSSSTKTTLYCLNEIIYDNPLLNNSSLLSGLLKTFTMSQILDLSTNLSTDLIAEANANEDSSLILAGLQSLVNNNEYLS